MANAIPIHNLPTISAEEIHANNLRAFRIGNQARYFLIQGLRALLGNGLLGQIKYTSIVEYAQVNFGFGRSLTMQSIDVSKALDSLPLCTSRFQAGATHWSAIRAITRVAKPETELHFPPFDPPEGTWLEFAKGKTTVQIEDEVQDALKTGRDLPRKNHQGLSQHKVRLVFELDREEYNLLKKSFKKSGGEMRASMNGGSYPDSKEIFLDQARTMLTTDPAGVPEGRVEREEPLETILDHVCPSCRNPKLRTDEGLVDVPIEHVERVEPEAKKVVIEPAEEEAGKVEESSSPAIDRPTPPSMREKVLHRDGLKCANPFCHRKVGLQVDHLTERSKGGRTNLSNLNSLCKGCHALKTLGLLIVRKKEDGTLAVERKSDRLTESILHEAEKDLSRIPRLVVAVSTRVDGVGNPVTEDQETRAMKTLERIGLGHEEARRRLDAAIRVFMDSGKKPTDHDLVQEALSRG